MPLEGLVFNGITKTVKTVCSTLTVEDVMGRILEVKAKAVLEWIESLDFEISSVFIIGLYLTGMGLVKALSDKFDVTVYDINEHLNALVEANFGWRDEADLVIDTTGIGGIRDLSRIRARAYLIEDPTSDGSDATIRSYEVSNRVKDIKGKVGVLRTWGLNAKTSGTMTLTLEVLRRSAEEVLKLDGVLYAVPAMDYYEGILFHEKDIEKFLYKIKRAALILSTLRIYNIDMIIEKNLEKLKSFVIDVIEQPVTNQKIFK